MREADGGGATFPSGLHRYAGDERRLRLRLVFAKVGNHVAGPDRQSATRPWLPIKSFILQARPEWRIEPEVEAPNSQRWPVEVALLSRCVGGARCRKENRCEETPWNGGARGACGRGSTSAEPEIDSVTSSERWRRQDSSELAQIAKIGRIGRPARKLAKGGKLVRNKGTSGALPSGILSARLGNSDCANGSQPEAGLLDATKSEPEPAPAVGSCNQSDRIHLSSDLDIDLVALAGADSWPDLFSDKGERLLLNRRAKASADLVLDLALNRHELGEMRAPAAGGADLEEQIAGDGLAEQTTTPAGNSSQLFEAPDSSRIERKRLVEPKSALVGSDPAEIGELEWNNGGALETTQIAARGRTKGNAMDGEDSCPGCGLGQTLIVVTMENYGSVVARGATGTLEHEATGLELPVSDKRSRPLGGGPAPPSQLLLLASLRLDRLARQIHFRPDLGQPVALGADLFYWLELAEELPGSLEPVLGRLRAALDAPPLSVPPKQTPVGARLLCIRLDLHQARDFTCTCPNLFVRYTLKLGRRQLFEGSTVTSRANRRGHFHLCASQSLLVPEEDPADDLALTFELYSSDFYRDRLEACGQARLPLGSANWSRALELPVVRPELSSLLDKLRYRLTGQLPPGWRDLWHQNVSRHSKSREQAC